VTWLSDATRRVPSVGLLRADGALRLILRAPGVRMAAVVAAALLIRAVLVACTGGILSSAPMGGADRR
jgi:hypothetical protein